MIKIPLADLNDFILEASLEGTTYFLHFSWNTEGQFWTMGVRNAANVAVLRSVVLVPNTPLLEQYTTFAVPPGEFVAYTDDPLAVIDRNSFANEQATLYYIPAAEFAAIGGGNGTL